MIRFSVFYPATDGATFDHGYYRDSHVPLASKTWKPSNVEIDTGVSGPYVASVHFTFESLEALHAALGAEESAAITADVANYTTIKPVSQTSEITSL
jgi:uncharacterized protein (TIGR02118 family)